MTLAPVRAPTLIHPATGPLERATATAAGDQTAYSVAQIDTKVTPRRRALRMEQLVLEVGRPFSRERAEPSNP